jgi:hypothetical protein
LNRGGWSDDTADAMVFAIKKDGRTVVPWSQAGLEPDNVWPIIRCPSRDVVDAFGNGVMK